MRGTEAASPHIQQSFLKNFSLAHFVDPILRSRRALAPRRIHDSPPPYTSDMRMGVWVAFTPSENAMHAALVAELMPTGNFF